MVFVLVAAIGGLALTGISLLCLHEFHRRLFLPRGSLAACIAIALVIVAVSLILVDIPTHKTASGSVVRIIRSGRRNYAAELADGTHCLILMPLDTTNVYRAAALPATLRYLPTTKIAISLEITTHSGTQTVYTIYPLLFCILLCEAIVFYILFIRDLRPRKKPAPPARRKKNRR